jgi:hypothetical protein
MARVPKDRATPEFKAAVGRFETGLNTVCLELVQSLMSQGWTQGEAEGFLKNLVSGVQFNLPEKGKDEIADEFLYGQGGDAD